MRATVAWGGNRVMMCDRGRRVVAACCLLVAAACNKTPTSPTNLTAPPIPFNPGTSCAPPEGGTVHVVSLPGTATPLRVWLTEVSPPKGATVRAGQPVGWRVQRDSPTGFTAMVFVGFSNGPRTPLFGLTAGGGGPTQPCRGREWSTAATNFPAQLQGPVHLRFRIWVEAGISNPPATPTFLTRAPDYEADEPLDWVISQ